MSTLVDVIIEVHGFLATPEGAETNVLVQQRPTSQSDGRGGVYVYITGPAKVGHAKVPEDRRAQWQRQCAPEIQDWEPFYWEIPHRKLLEKIIHRYLKDTGAWLGPTPCAYCGRNHIEKFDLARCGGRNRLRLVIDVFVVILGWPIEHRFF
ncbi:hypothetical protein DFH06DRAFT_1123082 [Mycena polygramma]|nr:hypothetical protein DFH06DRAFT_1123082 [Mycena polygramma]